MNNYYVYILTNKKDGVLYIGVTNDVKRRVWEHKQKIVKGFTKKYNVDRLMYFEQTSDVYAAIEREKQMKKWKREWKVELIEKDNKAWSDLYEIL
ncbi:hypothetical protein A2372_04125 [Candidatus Wolfebacteria bacterium RIFOXYB1_FULL_54_12]|uniref:GIY-YIG domain-containing protein n=1 Tax=Candidatus Wolfebacteria bacterium RIFOXYB1_FULL_54_12 TaxID=1802559 RepID=A0A1F8DVG7_9BACT|nr:MAG: hypothetical protein A2372_04125 [Candidatus Wolfebacteria bacterium RIFOXYB1_FULL_54_12]